MKTCCNCHLTLAEDSFHLLAKRCKPCAISIATQWNKENKAKRKKTLEKYSLLNKNKISANSKNWREKNREKYNLTRITRWRMIKEATPQWIDRTQLKEFYSNTPQGMTVDHIIPIKGRNVRGLHVPWNLQYLTPEQNNKKFIDIGD